MPVVPLVRRLPMALTVVVVVAVLAGCFADRLYRGLQPTPSRMSRRPRAGVALRAELPALPCGDHRRVEQAPVWRRPTRIRCSRRSGSTRTFYYCLSCHAPLEAQQPTQVTGWQIAPLTAIESPNPLFSHSLQREGVTCVACHLKDGAMVGPHEVNAPHPVRVDPEFR